MPIMSGLCLTAIILWGRLFNARPLAWHELRYLRCTVQGKVWGVQSAETGELVLYPREQPPLIRVSHDVAALWHEVVVSRLSIQILCYTSPINAPVRGPSSTYYPGPARNYSGSCIACM